MFTPRTNHKFGFIARRGLSKFIKTYVFITCTSATKVRARPTQDAVISHSAVPARTYFSMRLRKVPYGTVHDFVGANLSVSPAVHEVKPHPFNIYAPPKVVVLCCTHKSRGTLIPFAHMARAGSQSGGQDDCCRTRDMYSFK